mgnify:CR=1 FL=1
MKISYAICTHNEVSCLLNLINELTINKDAEDEVVILDDYSTNQEKDSFLSKFRSKHHNAL